MKRKLPKTERRTLLWKEKAELDITNLKKQTGRNWKYADTRSAADPYCQQKQNCMSMIPFISTIGLGVLIVSPEELDRDSMQELKKIRKGSELR